MRDFAIIKEVFGFFVRRTIICYKEGVLKADFSIVMKRVKTAPLKIRV